VWRGLEKYGNFSEKLGERLVLYNWYHKNKSIPFQNITVIFGRFKKRHQWEQTPLFFATYFSALYPFF